MPLSLFAATTSPVETGAVFTALAIVIIVSQLFGQVLARFGQPRVMGEIRAEGTQMGETWSKKTAAQLGL